MKKLLLILLVAILLLSGCGTQKSAEALPEWQIQFDLGVRYLNDDDYENAILAFTAVIEIDPNNVDAYLYRADAYLMGAEQTSDPEKAQEYLDKVAKDCEKVIELDPGKVDDVKDKQKEIQDIYDELDSVSDTVNPETRNDSICLMQVITNEKNSEYVGQTDFIYNEHGQLVRYLDPKYEYPIEEFYYSSDGKMTGRHWWGYDGWDTPYDFKFDSNGRLIEESCNGTAVFQGLHTAAAEA